MIKVTPSGKTLGATIEGLDLSRPMSDEDFRAMLHALGHNGVLRIPDQKLTSLQLRDFSARFGELEINVANTGQVEGIPEMMILSNIVEDGKPVGLGDAGQGWHTDMSYSKLIAFANVLYGIKIPHRDGQPLGATEFANMHAAYDELPEDLKRQLDGMTVLHDFNKFWEQMRSRPGGLRGPLTPEQRRTKPPVSHPIFPKHPITGRCTLYADPGYSIRINELPEKESDEVLEFLFNHQLQEQFLYTHLWTENDVLMWDNMGTLHQAIPDYGPDEPRYIKRCQVMATMFFGRA